MIPKRKWVNRNGKWVKTWVYSHRVWVNEKGVQGNYKMSPQEKSYYWELEKEYQKRYGIDRD